MTPDQKATRNAIEARQVETLGAGATSGADSHDTTERENTGEDYSQTQELRDARHTLAAQQDAGNVLPASGSIPSAQPVAVPPAREGLDVTFKRRMESEGRWREVSLVRDQMMKDSKQAIPDKESRRAWVYGELDRMYPPLKRAGETDLNRKLPEAVEPAVTRETDLNRNLDGQIQGLSEIPADWPDLPANASLAGEVGWVQANRLRIVEERPGRATVVRLDQALSPAPSWAALGWLETSIRSYAKFVDVAAKVSGSTDDEGAVMKRERRSVDEVRALLDEMMEAEGTCPSCGRPF